MLYTLIRKHQTLKPWLATGLLIGSSQALALGGHFAVDDAALVDAGRCEVETWYTHFNGNNNEFTVLPTCNPTGQFDLGLGLSRVQEGGDTHTEVALEGKTLWRTQDDHGFGMGLAAAAIWNDDSKRVDDVELYVPLSIPHSERLTSHYNLGWAWARDDRNAVIWGAALEYAVEGPLHLVAETWGDHRGSTRVQAGLRFAFDALLIDVAWQRRFSSHSDNAATLGFAVAF